MMCSKRSWINHVKKYKLPYSRKVRWGKVWWIWWFNSSVIRHQTKPFMFVLKINNLLVDLFIHQTLGKDKYGKHSPHQNFLLYGIIMCKEFHMTSLSFTLLTRIYCHFIQYIKHIWNQPKVLEKNFGGKFGVGKYSNLANGKPFANFHPPNISF